jgi:hypothetical protein
MAAWIGNCWRGIRSFHRSAFLGALICSLTND